MSDKSFSTEPNMVLGKVVEAQREYSPNLLHRIPREESRKDILSSKTLPFVGEDLWHAYELSWIDKAGKPAVYAGHFSIPCDSPFLVESKLSLIHI